MRSIINRALQELFDRDIDERSAAASGPSPQGPLASILRNDVQWLAWKYRNGQKIPINPRTGIAAKSDDPTTWHTLDVALERAADGTCAGVGIALGDLRGFENCGLCGIDLDTCRDIETGLYTPWAQEILDYFGEDYAELPPSATGVKLFFAYRLNEIAALRAALGISPGGWSAAYKNGAGGKHEPAIEAHLGHRYFCVTFNPLPDRNKLLIISIEDAEWLAAKARETFPSCKASQKTTGNGDARATPGVTDHPLAIFDDGTRPWLPGAEAEFRSALAFLACPRADGTLAADNRETWINTDRRFGDWDGASPATSLAVAAARAEAGRRRFPLMRRTPGLRPLRCSGGDVPGSG